jgi:hypothetical protein
MLNERLLHYELAVDIVDEAILNVFDIRAKLCLLLIKMIAFASTNEYDKCAEIFNHVYKNENYTCLIEYGYFLRNSEIVLPLDVALTPLTESVDFFSKINPTYAEHSRISLSMNQARLGMLDVAMENLQIVKEKIYEQTLEKHIILNNVCAIEMCGGNYGKEVSETLKLAGFYALTVFDKILVHRNLIVVLKKLNEYSQGEKIIELLNSLIHKEKDKLNICYAYWNISYFYKDYNSIKYNYYQEMYRECFAKLLKNGIRKNEIMQEGAVCKPNMEFVIDFISYWHFPLPQEDFQEERPLVSNAL